MFKNLFRDKKFYKTLLTLALPIMIQNFLASSLNMVDTLMIGRVGEAELAAVGIANQLFFLFSLIGGGVAAGCSIFISQYWGQKDRTNIKKVLGLGLIVNVLFGLVFMLFALLAPAFFTGLFSRNPAVIPLSVEYLWIVSFSYIGTGVTFVLANALRSVGSAYVPMLVSLLAILTNAGLNYLFIFGKGGFPVMGVGGAALATLIARIVEVVVLLLFTFRPRSPFFGKWREFLHISKAFAAKILRAMIPVILNEGCWALGFILYTVAYGFIGDGVRAIAAAQIGNTVQNLFLVLCFSLANASLVMIGNLIGAGKLETAKSYARKFTGLSLLLGIVTGILMLLTAPFILSFFKISDEARIAAIAILRIFAVMAPVKMLTITLIVGVFRGGGDTGFSLKAEAGTMWLIGVPLAFFASVVLQWPVEWVVLLITLEEIVKCALCLTRFKGNRWMRDLTADN